MQIFTNLCNVLTAASQYFKQLHLCAAQGGYSLHLLTDKIYKDLDEANDRLKELSISVSLNKKITIALNSLEAADNFCRQIPDNTDTQNIPLMINNCTLILEDLGVLVERASAEVSAQEIIFKQGLLNALGDISEKLAKDKYLLNMELSPLSANVQDEFDESKVNRDDLGRFAEQNKTKADNPPDINSFLGEEFTGYKGQEAVNKLLQEQRGHIKAAFHRDDIGDITLAWGNEEQGIAHLIKSRTEKSPYNVDVILERLTETIENGQLRKGKSGNFEIWHKGIMVVVRPDYYGEDIRFVVTGFKQRSLNKNSTTREDAAPGL